MLGEESDDGVVAANAIRELQDVVSLVLEHEVVDVATEPSKLLDEVVRLPLDDARVVRGLVDVQYAAPRPTPLRPAPSPSSPTPTPWTPLTLEPLGVEPSTLLGTHPVWRD